MQHHYANKQINKYIGMPLKQNSKHSTVQYLIDPTIGWIVQVIAWANWKLNIKTVFILVIIDQPGDVCRKLVLKHNNGEYLMYNNVLV